MGTIIRGVKNAFRNLTRTVSVAVILAISIGLALIMLLSYRTVDKRITTVKSSMGNTITVSPAGVQGFEGGGEPLTDSQIDALAQVTNVTGVNKSVNSRTTSETTNLVSAIEAGTLGKRFNDQNKSNSGSTSTSTQQAPPEMSGRSFTPPVTLSGISNPSMLITGTATITSGSMFQGSEETNVAVVGSSLATKNNLAVGSTFTLYSETVEVVGIYEAGNQFANNGAYLPIKTLQRLSSQVGEISSATVTVNSIENVDSAVSSIKSTLGSDKADVTSNAESSKATIAPLESIKKISIYGLIGSLVAGAIITLLIMMMIVRERRREIGVLKAIGSSNIMVVSQFITESMVLTLLGATIGIIIGIAFSNPVLNVMVNNSSSTSTATTNTNVPVPGSGGGRMAQALAVGGQIGQSVQGATKNLTNTVGIDIILYGLLAAILISIIGSAIPAWLIAKVRPAEVMRGE